MGSERLWHSQELSTPAHRFFAKEIFLIWMASITLLFMACASTVERPRDISTSSALEEYYSMTTLKTNSDTEAVKAALEKHSSKTSNNTHSDNDTTSATVILIIEIAQEGNVTKADIHKTSGYPKLDNAAVASSLKYKFDKSPKKERRIIKIRYVF